MSNLDAILHDQPATIRPLPMRTHKRHDYSGWMQAHPPTDGPQAEPDGLRELLGYEYFDSEPAARRAPQKVPEGMHMIGDLSKALERSNKMIRRWIEMGLIPDCPKRTVGNKYLGKNGCMLNEAKRLWPADEINVMREIALEEGLIPKSTRPIANTNFKVRVWDAINELRAYRATTED